MSPAISVLMPAYNAAAHIREAIESILSQTEQDFEFIIVNDGSTDDTGEIIDALQRVDDRIVHLHKANGGIVSALNYGLDHCKGEFIARMDADDIALPNRFELQLSEFRNTPDLVLCGSHVRQFGASSRLQPMPLSDASIRAVMPFYVPFIHPSVMYRFSNETRSLRYQEEFRDAEDYAFWIELSKYGSMKNINKALLNYRVHDGQISVTKRASQRAIHLRLSQAQLAERKISIDDKALAAFIYPGDSNQSKLFMMANCVSMWVKLVIHGIASPYLLLKSLAKTLIA